MARPPRIHRVHSRSEPQDERLDLPSRSTSRSTTRSISPSPINNRKRGYKDLMEELTLGNPSKRAKYTLPSDPYRNAGRWIPHSINPFLNLTNVFRVGMAKEHQDRCARERATDNKSEQHEEPSLLDDMSEDEIKKTCIEYNQVLALVPGFRDQLVDLKASPDALGALIDIMNVAMISSASDDRKDLKHAGLLYIIRQPKDESIQPPIPKKAGKSVRGFAHKQTAHLLAKLQADPTFQDKLSGEASSTQWPSFLYESDDYYPEDIDKGLMRGFFPLRFWIHIFLAPSVASNHEVGKPVTESQTSCGTRSGNGKLHGLTRVSPKTIAYACTLAWFTLSSMETWGIAFGQFNLQQFHTSVVDLFEDARDPWCIETLAWWNHQVYGTPIRGLTADPEDEETTPNAPISDLDLGRQQRRIKAQRAAATATTALN